MCDANSVGVPVVRHLATPAVGCEESVRPRGPQSCFQNNDAARFAPRLRLCWVGRRAHLAVARSMSTTLFFLGIPVVHVGEEGGCAVKGFRKLPIPVTWLL